MTRSLVEKAMTLLRDKYIFPDKAEAAAEAVKARLDAGEYDGLDEATLGERLTATLFEICRDKHLRVRPRQPDMVGAVTEAELEAAWREQMRREMHGIARVERLDGNVGFLDLRAVSAPVGAGGRAIAAAMELVSHTHALIIDLRRNRGGEPEGVSFWLSYLFPDGGTHLNDVYDGQTRRTRQYWTYPYLPGQRYTDRPVYLLTSDFTFSGGEEFCYDLKQLGRATLVGETTRGGAHPTMPFEVTSTLEITIPVARSVHPVTGTNWEGTGVTPDIAVPESEAFGVAYRRCLSHVLSCETSEAVREEARAALAEADL